VLSRLPKSVKPHMKASWLRLLRSGLQVSENWKCTALSTALDGLKFRVFNCGFRLSLREKTFTSKVLVTIKRQPSKEPISVSAFCLWKHQSQPTSWLRNLRVKELQFETKRSKENVNMIDVNRHFDYSSREGLMFTQITGGSEIYLVDVSSDDFDQSVSQSPSFWALWHAYARNVVRRSYDLTGEGFVQRLQNFTFIHTYIHIYIYIYLYTYS
jgi:hypothetical protein